MTFEELKQEAEEWLCNNLHSASEEDFIKAMVDIAEPREKRIEELEHQLTHRNCLDCSNHSSNLRIRNLELEKENAELKLKLEALEGQTPWKDIKDKSEVIGQLTKAKELIKDLLGSENTSSEEEMFFEIRQKAEQFLKGEFTTELSNECQDCTKFDEMPNGPRCKTCDNGSHFQKKEEA